MISYANSVGAAGAGGGIISMLMPMLLIFGFMYFAIIRPQKKREKTMQQMLAAIKPGDIVDTNAGFTGKVVRTSESDLVMELQPSGVRVSVKKYAVINVRNADGEEKEVSAEDIGKVVKEDEDYIYEEVSDDETGDDIEYVEVDEEEDKEDK